MDFKSIPPVAYAIIALLAAVATIVFGIIGQLILAGLCLIIFFAVIFILLGINKKDPVHELFRKKRVIMDSISEAESKYLSRSLDETTYRQLIETKQKELVGIEAQLQVQSGTQGIQNMEQLEALSSKNRHFLRDLLSKKNALLEEIRLTEEKYLGRQLEETAFFELRGQQQAKMLEIDAEIKKIQNEVAAQQVVDDLKVKLNQLNETEIQKKQKKEDEILDDLSDQIEK